jgi:transposase
MVVATNIERDRSMNQITTIGLDLAEKIFQVHGIDAGGRAVVRRALRRGEVLKFFSGLRPCLEGVDI